MIVEPKTWVISIDECPRCGGAHSMLKLVPLDRPAHGDCANLTHWAECPLLKQPLLAAIGVHLA